MGRRRIGDLPMTGSDRRRRFEQRHYHDPIYEYQTTIMEQRLRIQSLEQQLAGIKAVQDNAPARDPTPIQTKLRFKAPTPTIQSVAQSVDLDNDILQNRVEELTHELYAARQDNKRLKAENKKLKERPP